MFSRARRRARRDRRANSISIATRALQIVLTHRVSRLAARRVQREARRRRPIPATSRHRTLDVVRRGAYIALALFGGASAAWEWRTLADIASRASRSGNTRPL